MNKPAAIRRWIDKAALGGSYMTSNEVPLKAPVTNAERVSPSPAMTTFATSSQPKVEIAAIGAAHVEGVR